MNSVETLIATLSGWVWGPPMLTLLVGTGLYLTVLLKGLQFRALPLAFRLIFHKDHSHEGDISHFAALMTALAATVGIGNMTQANSTAKIFETTFHIAPWVTGVVLMVLTALVIVGGIRSIGKFTSVLVPFMIVGYVGASLTVLALNVSEIPHAFGLIFQHALSPAAASGGFAGATIAAAMRFGIARGVFSNESGLGSAPIAAAARTHDPVKQALVSMTQTFIDTLVVVGAMMNLEFVWNFSDLMNGMMAIPNLIGLLLLSRVVKEETDRYFKSLLPSPLQQERE